MQGLEFEVTLGMRRSGHATGHGRCRRDRGRIGHHATRIDQRGGPVRTCGRDTAQGCIGGAVAQAGGVGGRAAGNDRSFRIAPSFDFDARGGLCGGDAQRATAVVALRLWLSDVSDRKCPIQNLLLKYGDNNACHDCTL